MLKTISHDRTCELAVTGLFHLLITLYWDGYSGTVRYRVWYTHTHKSLCVYLLIKRERKPYSAIQKLTTCTCNVLNMFFREFFFFRTCTSHCIGFFVVSLGVFTNKKFSTTSNLEYCFVCLSGSALNCPVNIVERRYTNLLAGVANNRFRGFSREILVSFRKRSANSRRQRRLLWRQTQFAHGGLSGSSAAYSGAF